eukprot:Nitzschia sp. Nitz4//scaffold69_size99277//64200//65174//NITZ4_004638-RA/size99277-processed-gene-0.23-mRNA-1//1//CDS//3329556730//2154//frame0
MSLLLRKTSSLFISVAALAVVVLLSTESSFFESTSLSQSTFGVRGVGIQKEGATSGSFMEDVLELNKYYTMLKAENLTSSMRHQRKFLERHLNVPELFSRSKRYQPVVFNFAAIAISSKFAFLHIWKCGGTTVADMTPEHQRELLDPMIQKREWLAVVRDPIDRFLSAWAECGMRYYNNESSLEESKVLDILDYEYDIRARSWLDEVKQFLPPAAQCHTHAFPQANYMLNAAGRVDEHVTLVGDLADLQDTLRLSGMVMDDDIRVGRDSSQNEVKQTHFSSQRELLSTETLIELCDFYAMDYYLFDFEPPQACLFQGGPLQGLS